MPGVPAARFTFTAPELHLDRVVSTPALEIRPSAQHGFVGAEYVVPGGTATRARVRASLSAVREAFGLPKEPVLGDVTIGVRPIPAGDGVLCAPPASAPGIVAPAAHPGVTLAASPTLRAAERLGNPWRGTVTLTGRVGRSSGRPYRTTDPELITERVLGRASRDGIILLHDIYDGTVPAVPGIIDALTARGYTFVTVPQLLAPGRAEPGEVHR